MAKYLLDPIKSYEEIRDNYILYLKTAFGTRFKEHVADTQSFEEERERLLLKDQVLSREPWIEPIPSYKKIQNTGLFKSGINIENHQNIYQKNT